MLIFYIISPRSTFSKRLHVIKFAFSLAYIFQYNEPKYASSLQPKKYTVPLIFNCIHYPDSNTPDPTPFHPRHGFFRLSIRFSNCRQYHVVHEKWLIGTMRLYFSSVGVCRTDVTGFFSIYKPAHCEISSNASPLFSHILWIRASISNDFSAVKLYM